MKKALAELLVTEKELKTETAKKLEWQDFQYRYNNTNSLMNTMLLSLTRKRVICYQQLL